ncbi:hypothetical protein AMELA_G00115750 [Ameiurus melas]|uniref:Uncharacterized protein n=1 Tax=Ameiurus melas TaxID=219545 RepID=A0A7J6ART8_AMEME|nr:hypothetical protein AMELA_G00115750 [Ameiurus melas]
MTHTIRLTSRGTFPAWIQQTHSKTPAGTKHTSAATLHMEFQTGNGRPKHNPAIRTETREEDKEESGVQSVGWRILPPEESRGPGSRAGSSLLFSQVKATSSYSQIPPYSRQSTSQLLDRAL